MALSPLYYSDKICCWCGHVRLSRILILSAVVLFVAPLIIHYYLSAVEKAQLPHNNSPDSDPSANANAESFRSRYQLNTHEDYSVLKASELRTRIEELNRIKNSVLIELRELESRRQKLQSDISVYTQKIETLKQDHVRQQTDLDRLKISVEQAQLVYKESVQRNTPELAPPLELRANSVPENVVTSSLNVDNMWHCQMFSCFDYSRCPLTSGFPVYFYDPDTYPVTRVDAEIDGFLKTTIKQALGYNPHVTSDPKSACLYLVLVGEASVTTKTSVENTKSDYKILNETALHQLPFWGGDGRNHVLINLSRRNLKIGRGDAFSRTNIGRAILIQSSFMRGYYRERYDVIVPPIIGPPGGDVWQECPFMLPARRKYLISFQGESKPLSHTTSELDEESRINAFIIEHLVKVERDSHIDKFYFQFQCIPASEEKGGRVDVEDWAICGTDSLRRAVLKDSTFVLILAPTSTLVTSTLLEARVYEALRSGAIPVILGGDQVQLSYQEVIDWRKACVFLPKARITELHFILRSVSDNDILSMRRQGRFIWENYLSSVQSNVDTMIALLRTRVGIPAKAIEDVYAASVFNSTFEPLTSTYVSQDVEPDESLGPIEPPYASPAFKRNFTIGAMQNYEIWNVWGDPFKLYPHVPYDTILPSDAKFRGSEIGFRPIGKGAGGAGKEFCEALGGNHQREQFTIVILTYEREQVLLNSIGRLRGLPYLNKVVVIWNSPRPPAEDLQWPDIGVPVKVVKAPRNSLNNRFLPLKSIETEAVLSVDDDAHLRHDEIIFGFRVWREHRDRVVGFPGRFHAWDQNYQNSWLYNSNYSCEFSMVLTGAAFVHKYFFYLYWYWLPQAVRDKVDEYMNCEDIAMNFLVSHVTRKPPVKVTSRWTFRCPGCPVSLSEDETHFHERHKCINYFAQIFGYTPLLMTQYRADSILFKTRIPHDKQKCFKFI